MNTLEVIISEICTTQQLLAIHIKVKYLTLYLGCIRNLMPRARLFPPFYAITKIYGECDLCF